MSKQTDLINIPDAITVDGSNNVGIGTSSVAQKLDIEASTVNTGILLHNTNTTSGASVPIFLASASGGSTTNVSIDNTGSGNLSFRTGATTKNSFGSERMRIDSSGNLIVGQTSESNVESSGGHFFHPSGYQRSIRNGSCHILNRLTTDGDIINFQKNGTNVGSISYFSHGFQLQGESGHSGISFAGNSWVPLDDGDRINNLIDLGHTSYKFDDIHATNGTIQTSDSNEKEDIASLTATEMLVGKRISALFKTFRWKDAVAKKGDDARTHTGIIAQDVQAAFTAEGLDAGDYSLFISSTWWEHLVDVPAVEAVAEVTDEDGNVTTEAVEAKDAYTRADNYDTEAEAPEGATSKTRMGIRYPELLSFVAAYNEQRFASIEARLTALEA